MSEVKLYDGCFVTLADGSVCGPVPDTMAGRWPFVFCGHFYWSRDGEYYNGYEPRRVTAVHPALLAAALPAGAVVVQRELLDPFVQMARVRPLESRQNGDVILTSETEHGISILRYSDCDRLTTALQDKTNG